LWPHELSSHFYLHYLHPMIDSPSTDRRLVRTAGESPLFLEAPVDNFMVKEQPMAAMPDRWIREMSKKRRMIRPFADHRRRQGKISYGVSSYGYDFRLSEEYKIPAPGSQKNVDPKNMNLLQFRNYTGRTCTIPPNSFVLGRSLEYFRIPRDIIVICQGKSTYARCGVIVNVTPLEPEWEGFITLAIINASGIAAKVYSKEGIAQLIFIRAEAECKISYADRKGKYQAQHRIQLSSV
jgi:dCTP deaminase